MPTLGTLVFNGFVAILTTREVIEGPTVVNNGALGANGSIEFRDNVSGVGAFIARGDIIARGAIRFRSDSIFAFASLRNIYLAGTG